MAYRIALIDDEDFVMRSYCVELELADYEVLQYKSVAHIKSLILTEKKEQIDFFIVDIMLPPGSLYSDESTNLGLFTGLFLARDIRKKYLDVPIIIFTNSPFKSVQEVAKRFSTRLDNCILLQKADYLPFELVDVVNSYFEEFRLSPNTKPGILKKLFGSLMLQPNINGIGIDLKQLRK